VASRDPAEFVAFAAARSTALLRAAYLMVGDEAHAQDLLQEALTRTYVAWPRLRDPNAAEAYTRRVITNTAISWFRRKGWRNELATETLPERGTIAEADSVAERDWVWQALLQLPVRQRAAIVLRYYEDLSEAQTADAMGCAVGTVKSQVSAGLRKLRATLGDEAIPLLADPLTHDPVTHDPLAVTR
jgi:RNA polymerase sigma-70 factor (sigma-E family)